MSRGRDNKNCKSDMEQQTETPITERSNIITQDIDISSSIDIVKQIHQCESQIFKGWQESKGVFEDTALTTIDAIVDLTVGILKAPQDALVVFSGCGTSGRLAFMAARMFNSRLRQDSPTALPLYDYLIAGRDVALFTSQEAPEDKPDIGVKMLKEVTGGKKRVLLVGITCGLSAPFVAGQLDYAMDHADIFTPVLFGFNPVQLSRNIPIENWDKTFRQVAHRLLKLSQDGLAFILTPLIGPEPITGSSRMKGGSATKVVLETIFLVAHLRAFHGANIRPACVLGAFADIQKHTYDKSTDIAKVIELAGHSLTSGGHVYYVAFDNLGTLGLLDASECPPTFGASFEDIRGFIGGGFNRINNKEGKIQSVDISVEYFEQEIVPTLSANDVVMVHTVDYDDPLPATFRVSPSTKVMLSFDMANNADVKAHQTAAQNTYDLVLTIAFTPDIVPTLPNDSITFALLKQSFIEIATKWVCNAVSTGAHVIKGKVCSNYMVDVRVSNSKLFHRAMGIIQKFAACSRDDAIVALLMSIYEVDNISHDTLHKAVSSHIEVATRKEKVVPVAILLGALKCTVMEAKDMLKGAPLIRKTLTQLIPTTPK